MKFELLATVLTVIITVNVAIANDVETEWLNFQSKYNKQYQEIGSAHLRKSIFVGNFNKITIHNKLYEQGEVTYSLAINEFADMTNEEFNNIYNGYKKSRNLGRGQIQQLVLDETKTIPDSFDWREKGAVTPVKNQGACGSCWAFSSTGALEGQHFIKTGKLISISEQNLVDCSGEYNNLGCDGGEMNAAFQYVHENDGIDSEVAYPYQARDLKCRYKLEGNVTSTKGYAQVESGNEDALKAAIATIGPIAVGIDAGHIDFQFYSSGVYYHQRCHNQITGLNHGVLAVGYGTEKNQDYWLIKNSWGRYWGEKGYIKMARNRQDNCGVAVYASYPLNY